MYHSSSRMEKKDQSAVEIKTHQKQFFQPRPGLDFSQLRLTNISLYSTTPWKEANFISRAIVNFYKSEHPTIKIDNPENLTITDCTANVGGNTISFYLNGIKNVNAVEIDAVTCNLLKQNLRAYKLPTDGVHCCDYLSIYKNLTQDVVFLDPPWGGPDYKKATILDLFLGQTNIIDICCQLMTEKKASLIVLKLPLNFNLPGLIEKMPNHSFLTQKIYRNQNYHSYNVVFCF
jgi:16S rRNA G966 N2-methylase RsmD